MLIPRILTGVVLGVLALVILFYIPAIGFLFASTLLALYLAWEWSRLAGFKRLYAQCAYVVLLLVFLFVAFEIPMLLSLMIAAVWWMLAAILVITYPASSRLWSQSIVLKSIFGIVSIVPAWLSMNILRMSTHGRFLLLALFLLVWSADVGAYFVGRFWGSHTLLPKVSPKKTWEGLYGGLLLALIVAVIFCVNLAPAEGSGIGFYAMVIGTVFLVVLFALVGDLFVSAMKRVAGMKDTGALLPGHGGALDRLDSLLAVAPVFLLACLALRMFT